MTIDPSVVEQLGDELYDALLANRSIAPLRDRVPGIDIESAYRIQERMVARRTAAGETIMGKKIGATSEPVQRMLGVDQPDFGILLSNMVYRTGDTIDLGTMIQPKAEGEIAFVLGSDLRGPGVTPLDVLRATDHVVACFEIVDSRIHGWDIGIVDTIADNASCGVYVLGDRKVDPFDVDLATVGMVIDVDGEVVATGAGAAVQASPANSVAWLANTLGRLGIPFLAGEVILSGSLSSMIAVTGPATITTTFADLGSCSITFA